MCNGRYIVLSRPFFQIYAVYKLLSSSLNYFNIITILGKHGLLNGDDC